MSEDKGTGKLELRLLGSPEVRLDGQVVTGFRSGKARALLYYLVITGRPQPRSVLAGLFWGGVAENHARRSLTMTLSNLRRLVGSHLDIAHETVAFDVNSAYWLDVAVFEAGAEAAPEDRNVEALKQAIALYRGDFLEGFYLNDAPEFEQWVLVERVRLRERVLHALHLLANHLAAQDDLPQAIDMMRRLLALEPWREEAHRQLMWLLARDGQRSAALAQFETCRQMLAAELDVEPGEETAALYQAIRTNQFATSPAPTSSGATRKAQKHELGTPSAQNEDEYRKQRPSHNLPVQPTSFIGREKEIAEIQNLLRQEPTCRMITLVGAGGIGKTRLALAIAAEMMDAFPHGVYLVSLASVSEAKFMVSAVAETLNLNFAGGVEPERQLLNYLHSRKLLLVFDNFEHLLAPASALQAGVKDEEELAAPQLLLNILHAASEVVLLVTSRERLHLQEEWSYEVSGLTFPALSAWQHFELKTDPLQLEKYSAIQLFLERARRAEAGFQLTAADGSHLVRICELVDGIPLGLELAAMWTRSLTCQEIAEEIERSLDFLTTSMRNLPERHRSLRGILEQTWLRLPQAEQKVLSKLSVFKGGCWRQAAEAVTGASLMNLAALVDKALLSRNAAGRYEMHELVRQFALEKLQTTAAEYEQIQSRHGAYYLNFVQQRLDRLKTGRHQKQTLDEISADHDNVRAAWRQGVRNKDIQSLEPIISGMRRFWEWRGLFNEGATAFQEAVAGFTTDTPTPEKVAEAHKNLVGSLLAEQGFLLGRSGQLEAGRKLGEQGLALIQSAKSLDQSQAAMARSLLAYTHSFQGHYATAIQLGRESLTYFSETGDRYQQAWCLLVMGISANESGQLRDAEQFLRACLTIFDELEERMIKGYAIRELADIAIWQGDYLQARQLLDEDLKLRREVDERPGIAASLCRRGLLAIAWGQVEEAGRYVRTGLQLRSELGVDGNLRQTKIPLGTILRLQDDHEAAAQLFRACLHTARATGYQPDVADSLAQLSCLAYDRGDYPQAEQYLQESLKIWQQRDHEPELASVLRHRVRLLIALGERHQPEARRILAQALRLAIKHQLAPIALDIFVSAAELLIQTGQKQEALELLAIAVNHPASTFETKKRVPPYLIELSEELPTDLPAATAAPLPADWQPTAHQLLQAIADSPSPA